MKLKKYISFALTLALVLTLLPAGQLTTYAVPGEDFQIGAIKYPISDLQTQISATPSGTTTTITLLNNNLTFNNGLVVSGGRSITLDLNGNTFTVNNPSSVDAGLRVFSGVFTVDGLGQMNIINSGSVGTGLIAQNGGKFKVNGTAIVNVSSTGGNGKGVVADGSGSEVHITGSIVSNGVTVTNYGARAENGGKITIDSNVTSASVGAWVDGTGSEIIINGTINASASSYVNIAGFGYKTISDTTTTSSKTGYLEYSDTTHPGVVWVAVTPTYAFTVLAGTGGTVSGTASGSYATATSIGVTAAANSGYHFANWTAIGVTLTDDTDSTAAFSMPSNAVTLIANFVPGVPTVTNVTVNPSSANVQQGSMQDFMAVVSGTNNPSQAVTWSLTGGTGSTDIDEYGWLYVDMAQSIGDTLTVRATSTVDSSQYGEAVITVTAAPPYRITLSETTIHLTPAEYGYGPVAPYTIIVTNTGSMATSALAVSFFTGDIGDFTLSKTSIPSIPSGGSDSFTITPITGLGVKMNNVGVMVTDNGSITETFHVEFEVNRASQTLTALNLVRIVGDGSIDLAAHATSTAGIESSAITYAVTTPGAGASISGNTLSFTSAGRATISATAAGSANYLSATTTFTLTVYSSAGGNGGNGGGGSGDDNNNGGNGDSSAGGYNSGGSLTTELNSGSMVDTPPGQAPIDNEDGSVTLPGGGTINTPSNGTSGGTIITVPPGTVIDEGGTITFPTGSGGGTITDSFGNTFNVPGGAVIILDLDTPLGYYISISNLFTDVNDSNWFYNAVIFVYSHGLMAGVALDMFSPNAQTTRGMIVTVLHRMAGSSGNSQLSSPNAQAMFADVDEGTYYHNAVLWAASIGIVGGYGDGTFGPNDPITRQDLAVILMRYADHIGFTLPVPNSQLALADDADISSYAKSSVEALYAASIIGGYPDGSFIPLATATRAEFASMLMRFLEGMSLKPTSTER